MHKLHQYIFLATVLLLLSWSDLSKYCRHQITDLKFRVSHLPQTADFIRLYDQQHTHNVVRWFEQAQKEANG